MEDTAKFEILEAIHAFAEVVGRRFESIDTRLESMDSRLTKVESQMVTKDYLDKKLGVLKGDLVTLPGKVDTKLCVFVEEMVKEGSLKRKTADSILAMEPFAR